MRPLRLVMQAFGPYPGRQVLDFRLLGDRTLFLIHGATGAGKTSILDAIAFALYGKPAGSERDAKRMRSDYADPNTPTEVVFDFRLHNDAYRVYRKPEYAAPKKRGSGTATTKAEAFLARLTGIEDNSQQKVLETGWKNVTEKIEESLGFRSDQFTKVVMLPQGEFQRLLMANSKERESILEVLFQTEWYTQVEEALKANAADLKAEIQNLSAKRNEQLVQANAESFEEVQTSHVENKGRHKQLRSRVAELQAEEKKAREALENGRRVIDRFEELQQAKFALEELQSKGDEIESKKRQSDLATRAQKIVPEEKYLDNRIDEQRKAEQGREAARNAVQAAKDSINRLNKVWHDHKSKEPEIEQAQQELGKIEGLSDQIRQLEAALRNRSEANDEFCSASKRFVESTKALEDRTSSKEQLEKEKEEAHKSAANKELFTHKLEKLDKDLKNIKKLGNLKKEQEQIEDQLRRANDKCSGLENEAGQKKEELRTLEETWIRGQSAILAQKLVEGEPCPVCGSLEHPQPAQAVGHVPDEQEVRAKKEELERIQSQLEKAREKKNQNERERSGCLGSILVLSETLSHIEGVTDIDLARDKKSLTAELKKAKEAAEKVQKIENRISELTADLKKIREDSDRAQAEKEKAQENHAAARAKADTLAKNIPEHLRSVDALEKEKSRLSDKIRHMQTALKKAEEELQKAKNQVAGKEAELRAAEDNCTEASRNVLNQRQVFEKLLSQHGFRDEVHFGESKKTDAELDSLKADIDHFEKDLKSARDRKQRAEDEVADIEKPDVQALEEAAATKKRQHEDALTEEATLAKQLEHEDALIERYRGLQDQIAALERRFAVVEAISAASNGRNPLGITFQRYVLATLLDDVLAAATQRFHIMSNGRFALNRLGERTDKRSSGGLDIEVYDAYTGISRPVNTLSGGEGFLASLSLALGLADVVQAYAGGINLDAIFVDEGFGSLDPEALDLAFRALVDLQQSGRLVGVISHVPELKERMDARLEVTVTRRGSSARLVVP